MRSGIVLISHDRRLLARISRTTIWLDRGITRILKRASLRSSPGATRCWSRRVVSMLLGGTQVRT
jgi:ATPase subunit of ABC transporter with duplicated ATPase domains